ncbi:MAG: NUDIX hydrolase [Bacteroidota bacterium]
MSKVPKPNSLSPNLSELYSKKVRVRACGILIEERSLLLINHKGLGKAGNLWSPPGGGLEFGESIDQCLRREFIEETGLEVAVHNLLFVHEYQSKNLHAVELFFKVKRMGGILAKGTDPEMAPEDQIISDLRFVTISELRIMNTEEKHNMLRELAEINDLLNISGYFKLCE